MGMKFIQYFDDLDKQVISPPTNYDGVSQYWISDNTGKMFRSISNAITYRILQGFPDPNFIFSPNIPTRVIQQYVAANAYQVTPAFSLSSSILAFNACTASTWSDVTSAVTWSSTPSATFTYSASGYMTMQAPTGFYSISVSDALGNKSPVLKVSIKP